MANGRLRLNRQKSEIEDRKEREVLTEMVGEESREKNKVMRINKTV